jgi:hypothetical protein
MSGFPITPLPFPPTTYDHKYYNEVIRTLNLHFRILQNPGQVTATSLNLTNIPTSSTGLRVGDVWHDTSDNTLKIVPSKSYLVNLVGQSTTASAGTVTV